jgi:hypothetical protein
VKDRHKKKDVSEKELVRLWKSALTRDPIGTSLRLEWLRDNYSEEASLTCIVQRMKRAGLYSQATRERDVRIDYLLQRMGWVE